MSTRRFAGQTTTPGHPEFLELWESKDGANWSAGFESLGTLFPGMPAADGIANVPDFWKAEQTNLGASLLHFGNNLYWLGNYTKVGPGPGQTAFSPITPPQRFGPGAEESHGYFDESSERFIWFGSIGTGGKPPEPGVPNWDGLLTTAREVSADWGLSTAGDFHGMLRFYPVAELALLRRKLLFSSPDAFRGAAAKATVLWLPDAAGNALDIEINVTWPNGVVPRGFGSVGIRVLSSPTSAHADDGTIGRIDPPPDDSVRAGTGTAAVRLGATFDPQKHGPTVTIASAGAQASWGPAQSSPSRSCNQVAFVDTPPSANTSYWLAVGPRQNSWVDLGWCSPMLDYTGASWTGPAPQWVGYQGAGKAWLYRAGGMFKESSDPSGGQGVPYGRPFGSGSNITAIKHVAGDVVVALEFLADGVSQGKIDIPASQSAALRPAVGCVAICGSGEVATAPLPPSPPGPPPPPPPPPHGGIDIAVTSGAGGSFAMNGVALAPASSSRPMPAMLLLRVLVDRSLVEGFAQGGRATSTIPIFSVLNGTALLWTPGPGGAAGSPPPVLSVRIWSMGTGYRP